MCLHLLTKFATLCIFMSSGEVHSWYRINRASRSCSRPTVHAACCPHRLTRPWGQRINTRKGNQLQTLTAVGINMHTAIQMYSWRKWTFCTWNTWLSRELRLVIGSREDGDALRFPWPTYLNFNMASERKVTWANSATVRRREMNR